MHGILNDIDLRCHSFSEWSEPRCDELELHFKELLLYNGRNVDLDFKVEHVVRGYTLGDLEEILLPASIKIIDEEATRVPIIFRSVEDFELYEGRLACLYRRVILVFWAIVLFWHVLNVRQVLNIDSLLGAEHGGQPRAPVFLGRYPCQLNIVLEADHILLPFLHNTALALLSFNSGRLARLLLHFKLLLLLELLAVKVRLIVIQFD